MICFLMIPLQVNVESFKEKRVVTVFGYKIQLTCSATKEGIEEEGDEVDDREGVENEEEADEGDREHWFPQAVDLMEEVVTSDN